MPYPEGLTVHTIWDEIACLLDSTEDLLSLALTCRAFKELVIPDHLEYRYIRCDLRRLNVWKFLESRPRLARGVQKVELIYEPDESIRLPRVFDGIPNTLHYNVPVTKINMNLFKTSLSHMKFLKSFSWKQRYTTEVADIFHVLTNKTPLLEAFSVDFYWRMSQRDIKAQLDDISIWTLTGLTKVVIRDPGRAAIQMILSFCPDIKDLSFTEVSSSSTSYLMQYASMRKLRRLNLWEDDLSSTPTNTDINGDISTIINSFLDRHINLETLHLTLALIDIPTPNLRPSYLPKLRSIGSVSTNSFKLPSTLSDDTLACLTHWQCPIGTIDIDALPLMDKLDSLYFPGFMLLESVGPFLIKVPNLKRILLSITDPEEVWDVDVAQEELIKILLRCSRLTHIFCDFLLTEADRMRLYDKLEELCKWLSTLQALQYFEVTLNNKRVYVKLMRDRDGLYSRYEFVTLEEIGEPENWGNFFVRLSD